MFGKNIEAKENNKLEIKKRKYKIRKEERK